MDKGLFLRVSRRTLSLNFALALLLTRMIPLSIWNPRDVMSFTKATRLFYLLTCGFNSYSRYPLIPCITQFAALSDLSKTYKAVRLSAIRRRMSLKITSWGYFVKENSKVNGCAPFIAFLHDALNIFDSLVLAVALLNPKLAPVNIGSNPSEASQIDTLTDYPIH